MKSSKKLVAVLMAVVALGALSGAAFAKNRLERVLEAGKIVLCTEPYFAPYEYIDNTREGQAQYRGSDIELAKFIADRMGVELEIVPLTWDALLAGITQGKYDIAISGMSYTPLRARSLEMSKGYKPGADQGIMVRKEDADKYKTWDDFDGKTVAYHSGTLQEQLVNLNLPKVKKAVFSSVQDAVLAVDSGKVDAVAVAVPNGQMFVASHPALEVLPLLFHQDVSGICVAAQKGDVELIARINEIIDEVLEKDLYTKWMEEAAAEAEKLGIK